MQSELPKPIRKIRYQGNQPILNLLIDPKMNWNALDHKKCIF